VRSKKTSLHPILILLAVALVSVLFFVACGDDEEPRHQPGEPKYGGSLTIAMNAEGFGLDPALGWSTIDIMMSLSYYENLLMVQPDLSRKPVLATSWEANEDLTSYTFHLREGVKFHHGKEFKAEDVIFTYNRILDPELGSPGRTLIEGIVNMVALDDYTVRFDLDAANAFFPDATASHIMRILPADVDVERLTLEEFGTGPFMIEEHLPGERTVVVRNTDYWEEGRPYLDEIVYQLISETATRDAALKSGDVDLIFQLNPQSAPGLETHPETTVLKSRLAGGINYALVMNNSIPPFDNLLVRKAMQAATDRATISQASSRGLGTIAYDHAIPSSDPRFAPQHAPPAYDPDLARSLLEQAGYPDGIDIVLYTSDIGAGYIELAVAFKESAAPAGIRVSVERVTADSYFVEYWGVKPFTVGTWPIEPNPDALLSLQLLRGSLWNGAHYNNPTFDELLISARGQTGETQKGTYAEIQRLLIDEVPRLVIANVPRLLGARTDVRMDPHPLGWLLVTDTWLDD
jgi:peptide/nickel transport system substrate-binding protein